MYIRKLQKLPGNPAKPISVQRSLCVPRKDIGLLRASNAMKSRSAIGIAGQPPMAEPPSVDQDLYRQLAKGREEAFSALYQRYQGPIFRFAWHMSGNSATAEDVTQEVFMLLIRNPRNYDPAKGSVAGYLFGIARNLTRRRLDRSRLDEPLAEDWPEGNESELASNTDLLADLTRVELLECLQKAVLGLPEQYREVIVLCDLEEMSYPDAAGVLQCPPGTIASRLHRARLMLKARLECQGCVK
jgi:RNA polymerase sigma-70 factor (ECF subfamily)